MSILISDMIARAAAKIRDPALGRMKEPDWLAITNDVLEEITRDFKVLEQDATHDITADESRYLYPDDCVQMKRWRWTDTPTDDTTYRDADEFFEDEFRARTAHGLMPTGSLDFRYWARAQFFELTPRPTETVADGGLLTYWKLATPITTIQGAQFELPPAIRLHTIEGMALYAKRDLGREEWLEAHQLWRGKIEATWDRIEDRSDDRSEQLRPATFRRGHRGMV